jgi:hypothetical protein
MPKESTATFLANVTVTTNDERSDMTVHIARVQREDLPERPPPNGGTEPPDEIQPPDPTEPPPDGGGTNWTPPSYLRTDLEKVSAPNVAKPGYLANFTDPVFHTRVTRITGNPGDAIPNIAGSRWGEVVRHHYSSDQAWNADQTLIFLDTNDGGSPSDILIDGRTYQPVSGVKNKPSSADIRWHPTNRNVMLYAAADTLGYWDPFTGSRQEIARFPEFDDLTFGPWEGSPSADGNLVALTSDSQGTAFAYDIAQKKRYPDLSASRYGGDMDSCRASPSGRHLVWAINPDVVVVTDLEGTRIHDFPNNYVSHFDVIMDAEGIDYIVGRVNSGSVGQGPSGRIARYKLTNGERTQLSSGGWSIHTSARAQNTRAYCIANAGPESGQYPPYDDEIIMCALDGSKVWRICHMHCPLEVDYSAQPQPSHSPDGGRVIFASAWGSTGGSEPRPVSCYVADFRE